MRKVDNEIFVRSFIAGVSGNYQMLKRLEERKEYGEKDVEFLGYCKGAIEASERVLEFMKELNTDET